jgi:DNA repair exonuclease SbcCD nuclease subunit
MKVAILSDTHLGVRNDSKVFLKHQEKFFRDVFFPSLEEHNVENIIHLGDIFDRRKFINFFTLKECKRFFFDVLHEKNITMYAILGNHDTYYTSTNEVNSVKLLLAEYDNIHVFENHPEEIQLGSTKFLMCPWIIKENFESSIKKIKSSNANVLCGHLDLKGFEMMRGIVSDHGFDHRELNHFESVFSGHYHHPSKYDNVHYLGAQYEMNWSDYGGKRGFYIIDTETRELTFIENNYKIHHKLYYDDKDLSLEDISNIDTSILKDCYVKIMVNNRTNPYLYDLFITKLNDSGAVDVKTIEDSLNLDISIDEMIEEAKDTKDILHSYIDTIDTKLDKEKIKKVIDELYIESMNI